MGISGYGKRLKEARKYAGLTQSQMGDELGVEWHKIKDMESERLKLSAEVAVDIEQKWSIDGWWLLTGKGEMVPSGSKNLPVAQETPAGLLKNHIADKEMEIITAFRELSADKQELYYHKIKAEALEERIKNQDQPAYDAKYA